MIEICFIISDTKAPKKLSGRFDAETTVLDALETLRAANLREPAVHAPVPAYRHSCHHGSCGTCGAIINGLESLMCLTRLSELAAPRPRIPGGEAQEPERDANAAIVVRLAPIRRGSLLSGIAARPVQALAGIPAEAEYLYPLADSGKAALPGDPTRSTTGSEDAGNSPRRVRFEACIECGLCSSSCPVSLPFKGPAALAAVNRQRQKRPESSDDMLALAAAPDGALACERHLACSRVCPQGVYPGKHIQLLRNAMGTRD